MEKPSIEHISAVFEDTLTYSFQECMKISVEMPSPATLTNFWVKKTMVRTKIFYNANIAELESPE